VAFGSKGAVVDTEPEIDRADRWAAQGRPSRNWWAPVAAVFVVAGYVIAVVLGAAAGGSVQLSDDAQVILVATAPSLGVIGACLAFLGTRRTTLVAMCWLVFALGVLLVVATLAILVTIVTALNGLD
jgi:4-amino-4-deoxy-L-arabinose transferase-like glycosyltransferase